MLGSTVVHTAPRQVLASGKFAAKQSCCDVIILGGASISISTWEMPLAQKYPVSMPKKIPRDRLAFVVSGHNPRELPSLHTPYRYTAYTPLSLPQHASITRTHTRTPWHIAFTHTPEVAAERTRTPSNCHVATCPCHRSCPAVLGVRADPITPCVSPHAIRSPSAVNLSCCPRVHARLSASASPVPSPYVRSPQ